MDTELKELYKDILQCLITYGNLEKAKAQFQIDKFGLFDDIETEASRNSLLHETGYYWAMCILYAQEDPHWYHNLDLWPPPDDYYQ